MTPHSYLENLLPISMVTLQVINKCCAYSINNAHKLRRVVKITTVQIVMIIEYLFNLDKVAHPSDSNWREDFYRYLEQTCV